MSSKHVVGVSVLTFALILSFSALAGGQEAEPWYTFNIGGGYTPLVGHVSDRLDNGWHVTGGLGVRA